MRNIFLRLILSAYSFHRLVAPFWPQRVPIFSTDFHSGWQHLILVSSLQVALGWHVIPPGLASAFSLPSLMAMVLNMQFLLWSAHHSQSMQISSFLAMHVYIYGNNCKCKYGIFPILVGFFFSLFLYLGRRWCWREMGSHMFVLPSEQTRTPNNYFCNDQGLRLIFTTDNVWFV